MQEASPDDATLQAILRQTRAIALVGHSDKPTRDSYRIAQFLRQAGYRVYPVNPQISTIDGQPCYAALTDIPDRVDLVNVFRRSEFLPALVEEAIAIQASTLWAQLGVAHAGAAQAAHQARLSIVMNRCIKVEYERLLGAGA